jgi:hypothetical protein
MKTITAPDGRSFKFGRRRPLVRHHRLRLKNYLTEPTPPVSVNYATAAAAPLAQMYLNDSVGDCVIAATGHAVGVFTGNAGNPTGGLILPDSEITSLYSTCCGYVPGNESTDQGCDIQTVLGYWENTGVPDPTSGNPAHKIVGIMDVDPTSVVEMQTAIWLFENLVLGVELPDAWVNPMPSTSGFVWDVAGAPDPNNGHCVPAVGYSATQIMIATWAMTGWITNAAMAEYLVAKAGGELYTVLSQDILLKAQQTAPSGVDWTQLQADFAAIGTTVPAPTPTPTPTPPTPTPTPTPTPPRPPAPPSGGFKVGEAVVVQAGGDDYDATVSRVARSGITLTGISPVEMREFIRRTS